MRGFDQDAQVQALQQANRLLQAQLEQESLRAEQLQVVNQAKDDLLQKVDRELKQFQDIFQGYAQETNQAVHALEQEISQQQQTKAELQVTRTLLKDAISDAKLQANLLQSVLDNSRNWIFAKDRCFRYLFVNQVYADAAGHSIAAMLGKDDLELGFSPKTIFGDPVLGQPGLRQEEQAVLEGTTVHHPQQMMTLTNNQTYQVETRKVPIRDAGDAIIGYLGIAWDSRVLSATDDTLHRHRYLLLEALQQMAYMGNWELDIATDTVTWSEEVFHIHGLEPAAIAPSRNQQRRQIHPDDVARWYETVTEAARNGQNFNFNFRIYRADNQALRHLNALGLVEKNAQGQVVRLFGTVMDVTERQPSPEDLRATPSTQPLEAFSALPPAMALDIVLQFALSQACNFLKVDRCFLAQCDLSRMDIYWDCLAESGTAAPSKLPEQHPLANLGSLGYAALRLEMCQIADLASVTDAPTQSAMHRLGCQAILAVPLEVSPNLIWILCCSHHQPYAWQPTEVKIIQAILEQLAATVRQHNLYPQSQPQKPIDSQPPPELHQSQPHPQRHSRMASLGRLVAKIAQEIRDPASEIYRNDHYAKAYTYDVLRLIHLYRQDYPDPIAAIQAELQTIDLTDLTLDVPLLLASTNLGSEHLLTIVQLLRNFCRLDAGGYQLIDLQSSLDQTLKLLDQRLQATPQRSEILIVRNYAKLPPLEGFPNALQQVFLHLLVNAIEALDERAQQSSLSNPVQPYILQISTKPDTNEQILIQISDNGAGISNLVQQQIFEPFFTTKLASQAIGLGLTVSQHIVTQQHGGKLFCSSAPGRGADFILQLPRRSSNLAQSPDPSCV
jgi:signal transduction histidine kinase